MDTSKTGIECCTNSDVASTRSTTNLYLDNVVLCHEATNYSIPLSLKEIYKRECVSSANDAIVVALHVLMCEAGFIVKSYDDNMTLLTKWRNDHGIYTLHYQHKVNTSFDCQLVCVPVGNMLAIHGVSLKDHNKKRSESTNAVGIQCSQFIQACPKVYTDPVCVYKNLSILSQLFKDHIALPLLKCAYSDTGICIAEFMSLPAEIKLSILKYLDLRSLISISEVCVELKELSSDDNLWKRLYYQDFAYSKWDYLEASPSTGTFKSLYKTVFLKKLKFEKRKRLEAEAHKRKMNAFLHALTLNKPRTLDFYHGLDGMAVRDRSLLAESPDIPPNIGYPLRLQDWFQNSLYPSHLRRRSQYELFIGYNPFLV